MTPFLRRSLLYATGEGIPAWLRTVLQSHATTTGTAERHCLPSPAHTARVRLSALAARYLTRGGCDRAWLKQANNCPQPRQIVAGTRYNLVYNPYEEVE